MWTLCGEALDVHTAWVNLLAGPRDVYSPLLASKSTHIKAPVAFSARVREISNARRTDGDHDARLMLNPSASTCPLKQKVLCAGMVLLYRSGASCLKAPRMTGKRP